MTDKEIINEKLENLKKYVGYLKEYQKFSLINSVRVVRVLRRAT